MKILTSPPNRGKSSQGMMNLLAVLELVGLELTAHLVDNVFGDGRHMYQCAHRHGHRYENAMIELIRSKQAGLPAPKEKHAPRPAS
jgi:hypothetical protein